MLLREPQEATTWDQNTTAKPVLKYPNYVKNQNREPAAGQRKAYD
jgi:hypothetical protein